MTCCIVGLRTGFLQFLLQYIYPFFFLSTFFVKDIFTPVQDRMFIFGIQNNNDKLCCEISFEMQIFLAVFFLNV